MGAAQLRSRPVPFRVGRVVAGELAAVLTLGLLAAAHGSDLARAEAGLDGGRLGWGLAAGASLLAGTAGAWILLSVAWALATGWAAGLWPRLETMLVRFASDAPVIFAPDPEVAAAPPQEGPVPARSVPLMPKAGAIRNLQPLPGSASQRRGAHVPRETDLPPLTLLGNETTSRPDEANIRQTAALITKTLAEFGIAASVIGYRSGPAVTQFAVQPGFLKKTGSDDDEVQLKVRVAQIAALEKDLALALSAERLRIEAPVPGKPYVGIEVPNDHGSVVRLRPLLESEAFRTSKGPLPIAIGRDVSGQPVIAELARMPHLLIAGATGSGKSVCITSLAACLAMNHSPERLRMVMIDSKMVELLRFNGLPHLLGTVETKVDRIVGVLRWIVAEMEQRYRLLEETRARDIDSYNHKQARRGESVPLPRIVVFIDELADMMLAAPDQTEHSIVRLAQMARATGIHLVVATQRPSTDVVTGLIKANFPARLAFSVASSVDSRVILDSTGAETLLGRGDLLFLDPTVGTPVRAQGVMVTEMEIERIIAFWQEWGDGSRDTSAPWEPVLRTAESGEDEGLVEEATALVRQSQRASASMLQRRLRVGYPRAARLLDQLEEIGVVGPPLRGGKEREVLPAAQDDSETPPLRTGSSERA